MPNAADDAVFDLLRLTLTPGLGPVLIGRALKAFGERAAAVLEASAAGLMRVEGIGKERARTIVAGFAASAGKAEEELRRASDLGVRLIPITSDAYPPLLKQIADAPPILYVRGEIDAGVDRYPVGIVGSRACTHYGLEQTTRFAGALARGGLTIVSGGARGIDTAAHQAAITAGRTIAVLGCGLGECYPPDNRGLFDRIVAEGRGAIVSELPIRTPPSAENFPARNRIISGLSLGVLVIEAGRRSGALITARVAAEDHGREVFALPSRVDSSAAEGSLDLLKMGGALMVTHPDDVLRALESPARHVHGGSHAARFPARAAGGDEGLFAASASEGEGEGEGDGAGVGERDGDRGGAMSADDGEAESTQVTTANGAPTADAAPTAARGPSVRDAALNAAQAAIVAALDEPRTLDQLVAAANLPAAAIRAELTVLEIRRRIKRHGTRFVRV